MKSTVNNLLLTRVYLSLIFVSLAACLYSFFKPGIVSPAYPVDAVKGALDKIDSVEMVSFSETSLDKDTSDRKVSPLFNYKYRDGSQILATLVRVRKRDDFKIETYGLLTKDIEQIYLTNTIFSPSIPRSLAGLLHNRSAMQTCIVPRTTNPEQVDFRLSELVGSAESFHPQQISLMSKLFGSTKTIDYSCLVLTYQPISKDQALNAKRWLTIVENIQGVLSK